MTLVINFIMRLRNTLFFAFICLMFSSFVSAESVDAKPKRDIKNYDYGRYDIKEYRDRGQVDRVEVKPSRGKGYILRDEGNRMPSTRSQDQQDQDMDYPTIQIRKW